MREYKKHNPICSKFPHMLHGGDYNPDQWAEFPEIINEDMRLIPLANCNAMSINIFSWQTIEPREGEYDFSFLDDIMDKLDSIGAKAILATPSGAKPAWMSQAHPEILRVSPDRHKELHGRRHNHCYTSPYYRKKVHEMNTLLAERYKNHPALILWHISNEYGGECHCDLCQEAFRNWLKEKYNNNLDELNRAYWSRFWSHTYSDWSQIESPSPRGEIFVHGLNLDWKRFVTYQTREFLKNEIEPIKRITPDIPVTTNFMTLYKPLDYFKLHEPIDVISWDVYPDWHNEDNVAMAQNIAFAHDLNRSFKNKPFLLMENTPSCPNWHAFNKLKKPGMHTLSSMQAIAHGSDSVQYFQWRKSRGSSEKFHGAVVDHCGHENTRVFKEVSHVGGILKQLDEVVGTYTPTETAVIFDWENRWAIDDMLALSESTRKPDETVKSHYFPFWEDGINVDVIDSTYSFDGYKLIVAPMLYMIKPGVAEKIERFVKDGGTIVFTYVSGWVDDNDLCFLGGFPGGVLKDVFGIWSEETDTLYPHDSNVVTDKNGNSYKAVDYCEVIHPSTAETLAKFEEDYYAGMPALTCNSYGKGKAYYIAFRDTGDFLKDFYRGIIKDLEIKRAIDTDLPHGVTAHTREDESKKYIFLENYNDYPEEIILDKEYEVLLTGKKISGKVKLDKFGSLILKDKK